MSFLDDFFNSIGDLLSGKSLKGLLDGLGLTPSNLLGSHSADSLSNPQLDSSFLTSSNSGTTTPTVDVSAPTSGTEVESKPITGSNGISDATANLDTTFDGDLGEFLTGLLASTGSIINANQEFNANQAQASREFLEQMSNTQYQRAVADLKAAGLNPILALGNSFGGASVPSSAPMATSNNVGGDTAGTLLALLGDLVDLVPALAKLLV